MAQAQVSWGELAAPEPQPEEEDQARERAAAMAADQFVAKSQVTLSGCRWGRG